MKEIMEQVPADELQKLMNYPPPTEPLESIKEILRTPDERFENLKDYPFKPNYVQTKIHGDVRIHYVDEGSKDAKETLLLMHGEPTWSYLYRYMIPILVGYGYRVIAPDLVGFGKSDKPASRKDYSYEREVDWMTEFVVQAGLHNITLFAQDWGGLIGLRVVARLPERFVRVAISNTGMPTGVEGEGSDDDGEGIGGGMVFKMWAGVVSQKIPDWGIMLQNTVLHELDGNETKAYEAPFPSESFKAATRIFPQLVPIYNKHLSVEENRGAWKRVFSAWEKPFITLFGDLDPITKGGEVLWQQNVPGANGQAHEIIQGGGHFIQEDKPEVLCQKLKEFVIANPLITSKM